MSTTSTTTPATTPIDRFLAGLQHAPLRRSVTHRKLGGVCAALGERFGLAPRVVRILAVVAAVLGVGVPAYLLAWLLLPDTTGRVHLERAIRGGEAGSVVLLVVTALSIIPGPHAHPITSWVAVAAIIGGLWAVGGKRAAAAEPHTGWPTQPTQWTTQTAQPPQGSYPQDAPHV